MLWEALLAVGQVARSALRLLASHWPRLLALVLLGSIVRSGVLWAAVWASETSATLGVLLVPLAPIATLLSLVLMLRVAGTDLPAFQGRPAGAPRERLGGDLRTATQVLLPFLAVYASQGLLREDAVEFVHDVTLDEAANHFLTATFSRALIATGWRLAAIVAVALVLRKVIAGYGLARRGWGWGALGGYVEALWLVTLAASFSMSLTEVGDWVTSRAAVAGALRWLQRFEAAGGGLGATLLAAGHTLGRALSRMGQLVVVPVAWLAIGATVHGSRLDAAPRAGASTDAASPGRARPLLWALVRRLAEELADPAVSPVKKAIGALRRVVAAGTLPMVLVCLVFVVAAQSQVAVAWLARAVVGPQDAMLWMAITPYVRLAARTLHLVLMVALLSAAVDRVVRAARVSG